MKTLLIVDIQHSMGNWFGWSYILKIQRFLKSHAKDYDQIVMVLEPIENHNESWLNFIVQSPIKNPELVLSKLEADSVPVFIMDYLTVEPIYKKYDSRVYESLLEVGKLDKSDFIKLPNDSIKGYYNMYFSDELKQLVQLLSNSTDIDIIGGGVDKCVELTRKLLEYHHIKSNVLRSLCYEIRYVNSNRRITNVFDTKPTSSIHRSSISKDGVFKMSTIAIKGRI